MKRINLTTALAAALVVISAVLGITFREEKTETPSETPSSEQTLRTLTIDRPRYVMREHEGHIAVFNEDGTLYKIYEVNVALLPEYDRKLLKNGIEIMGDEELRARVEDYTS